MNLSKNACLSSALTVGLAAGLMFGARAADFYVSADKSYGVSEGADADHRFDDLQAAINAAAAEDTIYVKDGFECKTGSSNYQSADCRIKVDKKLTLCGETGNWKTGPIIRGKYADACKETAATRRGAGAVSCVRGSGKANVTLIGFRLLEGAVADGGSGGCAYGVTLRNCYCGGGAATYGGGTRACDTYDCTVYDCYAYQGGGLYQETHSNAWIEGCTTTYMGGGISSATAYDCVITNCAGGSYGGGIGFSSSYRCTIVNCTADVGGGVHNPTMLQDSEIIGCNGSAVHNGHVEHCVFRDCKANGVDGSAFRFTAANLVVSNCTFTGNAEPVVGMVASAGNDLMVDCVFTNNLGTVITSAHNPVGELVLRHCKIECTAADGYAVKTRRYSSSGTKLNYVSAYDCDIAGPVSGSGAYYNCLISGANSVYPAVSCDTSIASYTGKVVPLDLYNCTVVGNVSSASSGGVAGDCVNAYNTIIRGNSGKAGFNDVCATADHCCLEDSAVAGSEVECVRCDPLLMSDGNGLPHPSEGSPCRASGDLQYVRTETDLAGNPRMSIKDGVTVVAMGACEFDPNLAGAEIACQPGERLAPAFGTFTASCSGLGVDGITYYWDFNGDGTVDVVTTEPTCSYSYPMPGSYTATLYASNAVKGVSTTFPMVILEGYFVSAHDIHEVEGLPGGWGTFTTVDGHEHLAYTNLQQAIDAASPGDIVWIDSDFVCDKGARTVTVVAGYTMDFRIVVDKKLTLRGKTRDWRTGPTIKGRYSDTTVEGDWTTRRGAGAVACVRGVKGDSSLVILEGIRLVNGATSDSRAKHELGGAGASYATLRNCYIADCAAYDGGCVANCDTEGCVISGGYATYYGGGLYYGYHTNTVVADCRSGNAGGGCASQGTASDYVCVGCVITNCSNGYWGGGCFGGTFRDSQIVDCRASSGGGAAYKSDLIGCEIRSCNANAVTSGNVFDSTFVGNTGGTGSGYYFKDATSCIVSNCTFTGNASPAVGSQCYSGSAKLIDCTVTNNLGTGLYVRGGNGTSVDVVGCRFGATVSGKCAIQVEKNGTNAIGAEIMNSVIEGPVKGSASYYNCLFRNISVTGTDAPVQCSTDVATGPDGEKRPLTLVNCTVASNAATRAAGGVGGGYVVAVNSIIRENAGQDGSVDSYLAASNSCVEADAQIGDAYACTTERPRFDKLTPGREFVPRASALRGMARIFPWMSDSADPRSRDLAGRDRITDGAPDMGAFEMYPPVGLLLMVR